MTEDNYNKRRTQINEIYRGEERDNLLHQLDREFREALDNTKTFVEDVVDFINPFRD